MLCCEALGEFKHCIFYFYFIIHNILTYTSIRSLTNYNTSILTRVVVTYKLYLIPKLISNKKQTISNIKMKIILLEKKIVFYINYFNITHEYTRCYTTTVVF